MSRLFAASYASAPTYLPKRPHELTENRERPLTAKARSKQIAEYVFPPQIQSSWSVRDRTANYVALSPTKYSCAIRSDHLICATFFGNARVGRFCKPTPQ